jgi:hypothetical protein
MSGDHNGPPALCGGCRWGQIDRSACFYKPADPDDLAINRMMAADYNGACHAFEAGQPKAKAKPSREEREWVERKALRAERDAAVTRAEAAEAEVARLRADALLILGRYRGIDDCFDGEDRLMLGDDECEALDALSEAAFVSTDDVAAAIGRVLADR